MRGFWGLEASEAPSGVPPQNSHFECQNIADSQTKSIHGQCFKVDQLIGHIYIYKGLEGSGAFGVTLRGSAPKQSF